MGIYAVRPETICTVHLVDRAIRALTAVVIIHGGEIWRSSHVGSVACMHDWRSLDRGRGVASTETRHEESHRGVLDLVEVCNFKLMAMGFHM